MLETLFITYMVHKRWL